MFSVIDGTLLRTCCGERLLVEPWGADALRVRSTVHTDSIGTSGRWTGNRRRLRRRLRFPMAAKARPYATAISLARIDPRTDQLLQR